MYRAQLLKIGRTTVLINQIMQKCLDTAFEAGALPREDTPKDKEIRLVGFQEVADKLMAGLLDVAERGLAGHKKMKGTVAKGLLGCNPTRLEEAWRQEYVDALELLQGGNRMDTLETCVGK